MNLRLAALKVYLPQSLRHETLRELFQLTAKAFDVPMPDIEGLSFGDMLHAYAVFSREQTERVDNGVRNAVKRGLYEGAYRLGSRLRRQLKLTTTAESTRAVRLLYRAIGIDLCVHELGNVTITQCYFSSYYSGQTCRLLSSLDEGLIAGVSGGGRLSFQSRITEGQTCCLARIDPS